MQQCFLKADDCIEINVLKDGQSGKEVCVAQDFFLATLLQTYHHKQNRWMKKKKSHIRLLPNYLEFEIQTHHDEFEELL